MILLDTDVLIDIALDRRPHAAPSSELLDRVERGARRAFVAWHTLSNFYYLVTPAHGDTDTRDFIAELIRFVAVAPADTALESRRTPWRFPVFRTRYRTARSGRS